jgi:aspartate kinase
MKVFKFGGAIVNSIDRIKIVADILHSYGHDKILVVISAMGKTTNSLEKVVEAFYRGETEQALQLFEVVKENHLTTLKYLLTTNWQAANDHLVDFFTEVEWLLHDKAVRDYDYYYDQIVSSGELMSTAIVSAYLEECGINNSWIDVRDVFRTDDSFRNASIDWEVTRRNTVEKILPLFEMNNLVVTQGFIGSTDQNESTTLGREGSDYTAAVFANLLNAESQTIWKDVEGVMNADPKLFKDAVYIPAISFSEVIEMAYYGAQVIHPNTIKPLHNKNIPLHVKCFLSPQSEGTVISNKHVTDLPPIIVLKERQVLMQFSSTDFSFVGERPVAQLYEIFETNKMRPNLTQNAAISLFCCLDEQEDKLNKIAADASEIFDVQIQKGLTLLTIRHYKDDLVNTLTAGKEIVLEQRTKQTIQVLMRG